MITVNFGTIGSGSDDSILDSGQAFSESRGFGWVTQASVLAQTPTPLDISANTRDRAVGSDSNADSLIHLQYPTDLLSAEALEANTTPGAWQFDLANGTYSVTVGVGDADFTDSNHVVNIEGETVISGFTPTEGELLTENTATVEVTDGQLNLDAIGGDNTKLNFVEIDLIEGGETSEDLVDVEDDDEETLEDSDDTDVEDEDVSEDIEDALEDIEETLDEDVLEDIDNIEGDGEDEDVLEDIEDALEDIEETLDEDVLEDIDNIEGDTLDEDVLEDIEGTLEDIDDTLEGDVLEDIDDTDVEDEDEETLEDIEETLEDIEETLEDIEETLEDIEETLEDIVDVEGDDEEAPEDIDDTDVEDEDEDTSDGDFEAVRVNFGPVTADSDSDSIQDIGAAFSESRGFGWVTQASVNSDNLAPLDVTANARDRNSIQQSDLDSLIHLQYLDSLDNPNAVTTPAGWEYALADGQYNVTVSVGDPDFTDSNHVINIEGNTVISGFTPTEDELFNTTTSVVDVTDGSLSIDAVGGENTKLNFVEIAAVDGLEVGDTPEVTPIETPTEVGIPVEGGGVVEMVQPAADGINVNFGAPSSDVNPGFIEDIGQAYSESRGFGWITQDSVGSAAPTPFDVVANGRDRNTQFNDGQGGVFSEPIRDSLIHLQYPTGLGNSDTSATTPAAWEYALENGQYEVTVGVGDPDFFDSNYVINVEGESVISGFTPTGQEVNGSLPLGAEAFTTGTATVDINDGRLTLDAIGGENTKINYISIVPV